MSGGVASDDFRDGVSTGADIVTRRVAHLEAWGIPITSHIVHDVARGVWHEYGGKIIQEG